MTLPMPPYPGLQRAGARLPVAEYTEPHAHGAPHFPFVSYASRAPPSPRA